MGTRTLKEYALKIWDVALCSLILHCVGKGPDDQGVLSWKLSLQPPVTELQFAVDNCGGGVSP